MEWFESLRFLGDGVRMSSLMFSLTTSGGLYVLKLPTYGPPVGLLTSV